MKEILIYPIKSMMSHNNLISSDSEILLNDLQGSLGNDYKFKMIDSFEGIDNQLVLILVQSGGSEGIFQKEIYPLFKGPYYLLTYGSCNSLAASLEILTFLKQHNQKSEVLHGDNSYIVKRIKELYNEQVINKPDRLGIIGIPSDWLISSNVDKNKALKVLNIELVDILDNEVVEEYQKVEKVDTTGYDFSLKEVEKALKLYEALKSIVKKYDLKGFTIRCFDILTKLKTSACLALALLNKEGIIASCEGDVPAMISAFIIKKALNKSSFQANPQWIDPVRNTIALAHCTLPLDMCENYTLDTHFESGIGIGIHGNLKKGLVTVFKINSELDEYYVEKGNLLVNEYRNDRCRTQIVVEMESNVKYFLKSSLGNHHLVVYGDETNNLINYLESLPLRRIK